MNLSSRGRGARCGRTCFQGCATPSVESLGGVGFRGAAVCGVNSGDCEGTARSGRANGGGRGGASMGWGRFDLVNVPLPPISIRCSFRAQKISIRHTCLHLCPQLPDARFHQESAAVAGPPQLLTGWGSRDSRTGRLEGGASPRVPTPVLPPGPSMSTWGSQFSSNSCSTPKWERAVRKPQRVLRNPIGNLRGYSQRQSPSISGRRAFP